jgi:hypothetical protein
MKARIAFATLSLLLLSSFGCGPKTYPLTFVCEADGGAECPAGEVCPIVPEGPNACGDLPSVLGHDPIPIDMARPRGCLAGLPFGNPAYADDQQTCSCSTAINASPMWLCGI